MKFGILWQSVSTWIISPILHAPRSRILISRSRIDLPVAVAGEIVVGDEEVVDALREVLAHQRLDIVGRAAARLAALHVDDGAERALERAAAAGIEARIARRAVRVSMLAGRKGGGVPSMPGRSFM